MSEFDAFVAHLWTLVGVQPIVYAIVFNLVLALAVALRTKTFTFSRLADFMLYQIGPYVIVYVGVRLLGDLAGYGIVGDAALALVLAKVGANIVQNLNDLGLPMPATLVRVTA